MVPRCFPYVLVNRCIKEWEASNRPALPLPFISFSEQARPLRAPPTSQDKIPQQNSESAMAKPQVVVAPVLMSKLSANAPEFYPSGYSNYTVSTNFSSNSGLKHGSSTRGCDFIDPCAGASLLPRKTLYSGFLGVWRKENQLWKVVSEYSLRRGRLVLGGLRCPSS